MRSTLLAVLLLGLLALGSGVLGGRWSKRPASEPAPAYRVVTTPMVAPAELAAVRATPTALVELYAQRADLFREALGPAFADLRPAEYQAAFCTVFAHTLAPFGGSQCTAFPDMLQADTLNCGNYGLLTIELSRLFPGTESNHYVRLVGWEGGAIGNHQMLFLERRDGSLVLVLDPTIGLVGRANFDHVACGRSVPAAHLVVFRQRAQLAGFEQAVGEALHRGSFRPADLLYYFESMEHLRQRYGKPTEWPTPGGRQWRERNAVPPAKPSGGST